MRLKNVSGSRFKVHSEFYIEDGEEVDASKLAVIKPHNLQKYIDSGVFAEVKKKPRRRKPVKKAAE